MGHHRSCLLVCAGVALFTTTGVAQPVARPDTGFFPSTNPEGVARWEGSQVDLSLASSLDTFAPSRSVVPREYVGFNLRLRPRFYFTRHFQLRASWSVTAELTDTPYTTTTTKNEARAGDPAFSLWFHGIPAFAGVRASLAAWLQVPVSPESRARTLILGTGFEAQLARRFERALGGRLDLIGGIGFYKAFHEFTTPGVRGEYPYSRACGGGTAITTCLNSQLSAGYNTSHALSLSLLVAPRWSWFSPGVLLAMTHAWSYAPTEPSTISPSGTSNYNASSLFAFWFDFIPTAWVTVELGYQFARTSIVDADGTYGNPFYSQYGSPLLYVNAAFSIDEIARAILQEPPGQGGIYRARSRPGALSL